MKKALIIVVWLLPVIGWAQMEDFSIRGGNLLRWAHGTANQLGSSTKVQKFWFEDVTDLALSYKNIELGLQHKLFRPSEFGENLGGIDAINYKYLEFRQGDLTLTAGNFYATFGRGLALNLYRDYYLNFDSNLEGFKSQYRSDLLEAIAFRGRSYPSLSTEGSRIRENDVEGAMLQVSPVTWGQIGGYYLYLPEENYDETRMPGGFLNLNVGPVSFSGESVLQLVQDGLDSNYYGTYFSVDYTGSGFGIVLDYKDYNFKRYSYSTGGSSTIEPLPYQNPPLVQREFTTNLLAKHPHLIAYDDEVGFQIEANVQPLDPLALTLNFSRSSSHRNNSLIPSLHEEDSPFWQLFLEGEYHHPNSHSLRLNLGVNEEVKVSGSQGQVFTYFWQKKQGGAVEGTYYLDSRNSIGLHQEAMRLQDVKQAVTYWEYFTAATFSHAPWGSFSFIVETTQDPTVVDQDVWFSVESSLNIMDKHNLLLFFGQDRGGLKCTSGRCRYVDPFAGVKITLQSTF
ncbi:MAG: DUF6029 family protein [bacterium]|nr:DUF6029 family protein [bacterium]